MRQRIVSRQKTTSGGSLTIVAYGSMTEPERAAIERADSKIRELVWSEELQDFEVNPAEPSRYLC
jgi:hypothetical protein